MAISCTQASPRPSGTLKLARPTVQYQLFGLPDGGLTGAFLTLYKLSSSRLLSNMFRCGRFFSY